LSVTILPEHDLLVTSPLAERRLLPRLLASDEPARLAWKEEGLRVYKSPARLIDISANGAGLLVARPAEPGQVVWLGIASLPWEWVKATIRATFPDFGCWRYHVAFCEPCPVGLLEQATGLSARDEQVPPGRSLSDDENQENAWLAIQQL
jgi:hypothetical protein